VVVFRRQVCMVSRAWCPAKIQCCVAVGRTAQLRRSLLLFVDTVRQTLRARRNNYDKHIFVQYGYQMWQEQPLQYERQKWHDQPAPETPMPEAPLIRVLETFDLSSSNIEHFLDSKADLTAFVPTSLPGTLQEHAY